VKSILSDELLRDLIAVGQVDVLVGLPTLNHADSVAPALRAAHVAFSGQFARERTVLLNVDGGSTDGTTDLVRSAPLADSDTLVASHSLRTRHRISTPYHGIPGKAGAIRTVLAAADLLQARAVAVLDPELVSVTAGSLTALLRPALGEGVDFVSPAYARHPLDGPLVTQVVRPLFRSTYGLRLQEPLAGEFACSGRFAAACLASPDWESDALRVAIDLWLSAMAAVGPYHVAEARLGPRELAPRPRPGTASLVSQVFEALFSCLRLHEAAWTARSRSEPVVVYGTPAPPPPHSGMTEPTRDAALFREGVAALGPMLSRALRPATLEAVRAGAAVTGTAPVLPDDLWAAVVGELAVAHRHAALSRDHLVQAAVPLYLGRLAAFAAGVDGQPEDRVERELEELSLHFERFRPELVSLWTAPVR
jgi:glucosylglycerate synthase